VRERPSKIDYYMVAALWAKTRSPDESTQHGCVIIAKNGKPLSWGYNGFPKGCDDERMPQTRPEKYLVVLHSEENAILNCDVPMDGATAYITGPPCVHCWSHLIQKDIAKVVYGPIRSLHSQSQHVDDDPNDSLIQLMLEDREIEVVEWVPDSWEMIHKELGCIMTLVEAAAVKGGKCI